VSARSTTIAELEDQSEAKQLPLDELRSDGRNSLGRRKVIEISEAMAPARRVRVEDGVLSHSTGIRK